MSDTRYAVYYCPPPGDFARAGASWLGWDIATGRALTPPCPGLTERPRRYGFHATLKPPFRLADPAALPKLRQALHDLAARRNAVEVDALRIAPMGRFLALRPLGDTSALDALAFDIVRLLDPWRAPPTQDETARRATPRLTARQRENLANWGYPHVDRDFAFHMSLTGPLDAPERAKAQTLAQAHFDDSLPAPLIIDALTLVREDAEGRFHEIERAPLMPATNGQQARR